MAIINIDKNNIPLKAFLRADYFSQHFQFNDNSGELVTESLFWGDLSKKGLYLDYKDIKGRSISVYRGISDLSTEEIKRNSDCDDWINNNILNNSLSRLFVIQGYAGCGKSTLIHHFLNSNSNNIYIDIGEKWAFPKEPFMFFSQTLKKLEKILDSIIQSDNREIIWKTLIRLGKEETIEEFDDDLKDVIMRFEDIKKEFSWKNLKSRISSLLNNRYNGKNTLKQTNNYVWHNIGHVHLIVEVIMLLFCAKSIAENKNEDSLAIYFDNLDVITNPAIPSENVILFWGVIDNYNSFRNKHLQKKGESLPNIRLIISVRKVLYSHIISHLPDLEMPLNYDSNNVCICDISDLYISQEILKHRVSFWEEYLSSRQTKQKLQKLKAISSVYENNSYVDPTNKKNSDVNNSIDLDAFFNHNYRAFSNVLAEFIDNTKYYNLITKDIKKKRKSYDWLKVATQVFVISFIYRKKEVWNSLGFGCKDFDTIDYPTTLNRLILNYLFVSKRGQHLTQLGINRLDIPRQSFVSLEDCIQLFSKLNFIKIKTTYSKKEIENEYNNNHRDCANLLVERLSDMCARNPMESSSKASGYDTDDDELWRRPIYFVGGVKFYHTATTNNELKKHFLDSLNSGNSNNIKFSITDEGFVLIRDIVAEFEFYSARYCDEQIAKPLHHSKNREDIDSLVQPVYNAIKKCCIRNKVIKDDYVSKYGIDEYRYFSILFHPKTNPQFDDNAQFQDHSFRSQLHIVRVIYNHIAYFNKVKKYFYYQKFDNKNTMCECLTNWIGKYLSLYEKNFYSMVKHTICQPDNTVYKRLFKLYEEQKFHYGKNGDYKNIDISNAKKSNNHNKV